MNFAAPIDGAVYKLVVDYYNSKHQITSDPTVQGDPVFFDTAALNVTYTYTAQLINENGDLMLLYDADGIGYDCIRFQPQAYGISGKTQSLTI